MLGAILGAFDPISRISKAIADAYIAKGKADTDEKRIVADERVRALEARRGVMVAEAGSQINAWARLILSVPAAWWLWEFAIFNAKDDLSNNQWVYVLTVIGFYYLRELTAVFRR